VTNQQTPPDAPSSILVVDDTPANLQLLTGMLRERGYRARPVTSGRMALQAAQTEPPDLILLDINMPEMNGYEVCERLKADEKLKEIPIIFISALNETMDKVKAFGVGGVDYVTKPFQFEEVEARVRTHLDLRRQKRALQESYERLRALEALRDSLVHMIVHDLRTPLNGIYGFLQLLEMLGEETLTKKGMGYLQKALRSTVTLMDMSTALLDVNKMEAGEMKLNLAECDLTAAAREVLGRVESLKRSRQIVLDGPAHPVTVVADGDLVTRVIQNLVGNALKFTPEDGEIRVVLGSEGEMVRVEVRDNGPGIPPEYYDKIFEKFGQVEARGRGQKHSTGLGLTFCKLAVEAHGGRIGVDSAVGKGSTFWFVLARAGPPRAEKGG